MKPKIFPYLALFLLGLVLAYFSSVQSENKLEDAGRDWLSIETKDLNSIELVQKLQKTIIEKVKDGVYWVSLSSRENEEAEWVKEREFLGNQATADLVEDFSPLRAIKVIGAKDKLDLADYGLKEPEMNIEFKVNESSYRFLIGKRSFQSPYVFLLDQQQGQVILARNAPFSKIMASKTELFQAKIIETDLSKVDRIDIKYGPLKFNFLRKDKGPNKDPSWILKGQEDRESVTTAWVSKFMRLRASSYLDRSEVTNFLTKKSDVLELDLAEDDENILSFSLTKLAAEGSEKKIEYWARSDASVSFMKLSSSRVETLLTDLKSFHSP